MAHEIFTGNDRPDCHPRMAAGHWASLAQKNELECVLGNLSSSYIECGGKSGCRGPEVVSLCPVPSWLSASCPSWHCHSDSNGEAGDPVKCDREGWPPFSRTRVRAALSRNWSHSPVVCPVDSKSRVWAAALTMLRLFLFFLFFISLTTSTFPIFYPHTYFGTCCQNPAQTT